MTMHEMLSLTAIGDDTASETTRQRHVDLRRAAQGETPLYDTFPTLARYREAHAHTAADLFERETWALTVIVNASESIWTNPASPTLRFAIPGPDGPAPYHLELGRFIHLAALPAPSPEERALIASSVPCWARVCRHQEREHAGLNGAHACAYTPVSTAEAVTTLGFGRILSQIESRAHAAGKALLVEAEEQDAREQRVLQMERMLGWAPDSARPGNAGRPIRARVVFALLEDGRGKRLAGAAGLLGAVVAALSLVIGTPHAFLVLLVAGPALLIWNYVIAA